MELIKELTRNEMKNIMAGAGTGCRVFLRDENDNPMGYSNGCFTEQEAQDLFGHVNPDGSYISGYCCASCGGDGFENATPCVA